MKSFDIGYDNGNNADDVDEEIERSSLITINNNGDSNAKNNSTMIGEKNHKKTNIWKYVIILFVATLLVYMMKGSTAITSGGNDDSNMTPDNNNDIEIISSNNPVIQTLTSLTISDTVEETDNDINGEDGNEEANSISNNENNILDEATDVEKDIITEVVADVNEVENSNPSNDNNILDEATDVEKNTPTEVVADVNEEENSNPISENNILDEAIDIEQDTIKEVVADVNEEENGNLNNEANILDISTKIEKDTIPLVTAINKDGFRKPKAKLSDTYIPRALPMSDDEKTKLKEKWGSWTLPPHPSTDLPLDNYPNGDIPRNEFPEKAWQTDTEYLKVWLPESIALIERSLEIILTEYGNGKDNIPDKSFEDRSYMFSVDILESRNPNTKPPYNLKKPPGNAGYATKATLDSIKRRLLHSIMLEDTFILVMGGHSASAGHGNHFQQSYTLQIQRILEPILARLGVYHQSHNFGMGGLGTSQNALASGDLYGQFIDVLIWDSGMTEPDQASRDLFVRQAIMSGKKVPVIWGDLAPVYQAVAPEIGSISTGNWGAFTSGMPWTVDEEEVKSIPWAARYLNCGTEATALCKNNRYAGSCWIDRDDVQPPSKQKAVPGGQASWHPGYRLHQANGRAIAFIILRQLLIGLQEWFGAENFTLPDEAWHVTNEYDRMRDAVHQTNNTACFNSLFPARACTSALRGKSEFTPRYNPEGSSIRSIVMEGVKVSEPEPNIYDPPDARLYFLDPPENHVHVLRVIENGIEYSPNKARKAVINGEMIPARRTRELDVLESTLPPGQGWGLDTLSAPDNCDGTWDSFCGRSKETDCILSGHNDHRGGLLFDGFSGWLKLNLENVTEGLIFVRIEDWTGAWMNAATKDFNCENNENCDNRSREIKENDGENFIFEFAIDGKVTSWDKKAFDANRKQAQRVVHLWTLLDDPNYNEIKTNKNVELAIRLKECGRKLTFSLTHVYWA